MSRRVLTAARILRQPMQQPLRSQLPLPILMTQLRAYAQTIVKVPQMAESITEGTLKQWSKKIGDYVEQDEEIATIETDKVILQRVHTYHPSNPTLFPF
jgi:2-oxoglutarate dehydrogenase E2 component (dihydrolipoamide succinyltransferase)